MLLVLMVAALVVVAGSASAQHGSAANSQRAVSSSASNSFSIEQVTSVDNKTIDIVFNDTIGIELQNMIVAVPNALLRYVRISGGTAGQSDALLDGRFLTTSVATAQVVATAAKDTLRIVFTGTGSNAVTLQGGANYGSSSGHRHGDQGHAPDRLHRHRQQRRDGGANYELWLDSNNNASTTLSAPWSTTLAAASAAGVTNIKVTSVTNLAVGQTITIDTGGSLETRTITGPTEVHGLFNGTSGASGSGVDLSAPLDNAHAQSSAPVAQVGAVVGSSNIKVDSVADFAPGQSITIDSGDNAETAVVSTVGAAGNTGPGLTFTAGTNGSGLTLAAPLTKTHAAGAPVAVMADVRSLGSLHFTSTSGAPLTEVADHVTAHYAFSGSSTVPQLAAIASAKFLDSRMVRVTFNSTILSGMAFHAYFGNRITLATASPDSSMNPRYVDLVPNTQKTQYDLYFPNDVPSGADGYTLTVLANPNSSTTASGILILVGETLRTSAGLIPSASTALTASLTGPTVTHPEPGISSVSVNNDRNTITIQLNAKLDQFTLSPAFDPNYCQLKQSTPLPNGAGNTTACLNAYAVRESSNGIVGLVLTKDQLLQVLSFAGLSLDSGGNVVNGLRDQPAFLPSADTIVVTLRNGFHLKPDQNQANAAQSCRGETYCETASKPDQNQANAAQSCRAEQNDANFAANHGGKTFAQFYGTNKNGRNAFGKCVSQKAKNVVGKNNQVHGKVTLLPNTLVDKTLKANTSSAAPVPVPVPNTTISSNSWDPNASDYLTRADGTVAFQLYDYRNSAQTPTAYDDIVNAVPDRTVVKTFPSIVVDNKYIKATFVPSFGGRLLSLIYKPTGNDLLYKNPVGTEYQIGNNTFYYHWLQVWGGIMPTFSESEHGKFWNQPWTYTETDNPDSIVITASVVDNINETNSSFRYGPTGLTLTVTYTIHKSSPAVDMSVHIHNPNSTSVDYEYWTCNTLAPGVNAKGDYGSPTMQVVAPVSTITRDNSYRWMDGVEAGTGTPRVLILNNMTKIYNWMAMGIAYGNNLNTGTQKGWWGVVNHENDQGILRIATSQGGTQTVTPGMKYWMWGFESSYGTGNGNSFTTPSPLTTSNLGANDVASPNGANRYVKGDSLAAYIELWDGVSKAFRTSRSIAAGGDLDFTDQYIPTMDLANVTNANADGAAFVKVEPGATDATVTADVWSTHIGQELTAKLIDLQTGETIVKKTFVGSAYNSFRLSGLMGSGDSARLELDDASGNVLLTADKAATS